MYLKSYNKKSNQQVLDDAQITTDADTNYENVLKAGLKKLESFPMDKLSPVEKKRFARLLFSVRHNILVNDFRREGDLALAGKKNDFPAAAKKLWDYRAATVKEFPEHYYNIVRRTERRYWMIYQPYRDSTQGDKVQLTDLAAGWRNSFDEPSLQGWSPRKAFKEITMKEASFDRFSVAVKPTSDSEIVIFRPAVAVTPGAKYTIVYDVKAPAGGKFRVRVVAKGKTIANFSTSAKGDNWSQKQGTFTVPAGVDKITLYLYASHLSGEGYFDNVVLTRLQK